MDPDLKWIVGVALTTSLGWLTILVGAFWKIISMIRQGDETLHARINRVREDTVHKTDLAELSTRISKDLHEIRDEQRTANSATNQRLDALLNAIANRNDRRSE